ncbi:MerR family transcriptional regulator [Actinoplanes sp. HUAS TT8]|uniref:MerR family transcriptional regulator n=1 Tax=Actinoplanes sp. HUAS TT8 TaxID=3447453 RepID=UPI003F526E7D
MQIGELSQRAGVSVRALRHYEVEGLLRPGRCANGYRVYQDDAVELVRQIQAMIANGLPIRIIREVLPYLDGPTDLMPEVPCDHLVEQVAAQVAQLDERIRSLTRNRDALGAYLLAARTALDPDAGVMVLASRHEHSRDDARAAPGDPSRPG